MTLNTAAAALSAALLLSPWPAGAVEYDRSLEIGSAAVTYRTPVRAVKRAESTDEFQIYDLSYLGRKFMVISFGAVSRFPTGAVGSRKPVKKQIGGLPARDIPFIREKLRFRETLVELDPDGWPTQVHFYYHQLERADAARADRVIASIRRVPTP